MSWESDNECLSTHDLGKETKNHPTPRTQGVLFHGLTLHSTLYARGENEESMQKSAPPASGGGAFDYFQQWSIKMAMASAYGTTTALRP